MESTFKLAAMRDRRQMLTLHGSFPPHWPGNLASGLAAHQIGIVSGQARKKRFEWDASFVLDFSRYPGSPDIIDFLEVARTEPDNLPEEAIRLTACNVQRLPTGDVEVRLVGNDQIGFLARFLRKATFVSLFPREFDIDTVAGRINDRFVFGGVANLTPTPAVVMQFESALRGLLEGRSER